MDTELENSDRKLAYLLCFLASSCFIYIQSQGGSGSQVGSAFSSAFGEARQCSYLLSVPDQTVSVKVSSSVFDGDCSKAALYYPENHKLPLTGNINQYCENQEFSKTFKNRVFFKYFQDKSVDNENNRFNAEFKIDQEKVTGKEIQVVP